MSTDKADHVEWAAVDARTVVVATPAKTWLHDPGVFSQHDPFAKPMTGPGTVATTAGLLDGAIAAAQRLAGDAPPRPKLTLARWIWRLAGFYHTTHATPPLMAEAAERFTRAGRKSLADYAQSKVRDEAGHDKLALADLRALGLPANDLVNALKPPTALALVAYFTECVRGDDPARSLGYAYALERLASTTSERYVREVEALLPHGVKATRCLRLHSAVGADVDHVRDVVEVAATLSADERTRVEEACYRTAAIICSPPADGHVAEADLEQAIAAAAPRTLGQLHRPVLSPIIDSPVLPSK